MRTECVKDRVGWGRGRGRERSLCNWQPNGVGINLSPGGIF